MSPEPQSPFTDSSDVDLDWDLLDRHLAGACDAEESARAKAMLRRHPAAQRLMGHLLDTVAPSQEAPSVAEKAALVHQLRREWSVTSAPVSRRAPRVARPWSRVFSGAFSGTFPRATARWIGAVAAAAVIAVGVYTVRHRSVTAAAPDRIYATHRGERVTVRLADGSSVVLGAQSTLRYGSSFGHDNRNVYLDGEAYFTVAHHAAAPFVVYTTHSATQVLGTEFFLKAYPADSDAQIAVTDGKVALRARTAAPGSGVSLVYGDVARIDARGLMTVARGVPVDAYAEWTHGRLPFVRSKMSDVVAELERWYDVTIVVRDSTLAHASVSVTLDAESADQAMDLLSDILNASWTRSGHIITLSSKRRS
jgi:ferric-dicitrate binding protein FerR (iron transport regulator)